VAVTGGYSGRVPQSTRSTTVAAVVGPSDPVVVSTITTGRPATVASATTSDPGGSASRQVAPTGAGAFAASADPVAPDPPAAEAVVRWRHVARGAGDGGHRVRATSGVQRGSQRADIGNVPELQDRRVRGDVLAPG
jgi:hypothetical protein